jgi:flagellar L-ring protein precursor FlgH
MSKVPHAFALFAAVALAGGCATVMGDARTFKPQQIEPAPLTAQAAPVATGGSIYAGAGALRLFEDNKARNVGDVLTIVLVERTTARTSAKTSVSKDASVGIGIPSIAGRDLAVLEAEIEGSRGFDGSGNSTQSNQLSGQVTVRVLQDLGNGHLLVGGQKSLRLNQGDETVQIQGIVRTADIGPDNRIPSDRVADAQILYGGRGTLARSNAMGWLGRFFNSAAFPY